MSTKAGKSDNTNGSGPQENAEGGLVPAILAGAGILAVVGLLVFWPSDGDDAKNAKDGEGARAAAASRSSAGRENPSARGGGGVAARAVDDAARGRTGVGKVNPALLPKHVGMAPAVPPPEEPPKFENVEQEIAWYEKKLGKASEEVEARKKNVERLNKTRQRAEDSPDPSAALARYEKTEKVVQGNLAQAEKKVGDIEKKLASLRGQ